MPELESPTLPLVEAWRPVPGYEGRYDVSSEGRVRSLWIRGKSYSHAREEPKVLKARPNGAGYPTVHLCNDEGQRTCYVHELVLSAFVGPRPAGYDASHINGNRADNCVVNLCWEPHKDNNDRRRGHGTSNEGEGHPQVILTADKVVEIRHRYAAGETAPSLAKEFSVKRNTIYGIVKGTNWQHVGGPRTKNRRHP